MKREIKFRGKRIDNGEWVYGNLIIEDDECYISTGFPGIALDEDYWANSYGYPPSSSDFHITNIYEVISETVGQFTGLKDKNGAKIFDGDILKTDGGDIVEVRYEKIYASFGIWKKGWAFLHYFHEAVEPQCCEVIGNIHDKAQQKQALIDMMRGDEELGLYDDNPKNHGYER